MPSRRRPPRRRVIPHYPHPKTGRESLVRTARRLDTVSDLCAFYDVLEQAIGFARRGTKTKQENAAAFRAAFKTLEALRKKIEPHVRARIGVLKGRGVDRLVHKAVMAFFTAPTEPGESMRSFTPRSVIPRKLLKP